MTDRLTALQKYDAHVDTCTATTGTSMQLEDGWQAALQDRCPIANELWAAVQATQA